MTLVKKNMLAHLLVAGFQPFTWRASTAGGGRFRVALSPAAIAVTGVVALFVCRGMMVFPFMGASTVVGSLSGGCCFRCWLTHCSCEGRKYCWVFLTSPKIFLLPSV